MDCNCDGVDHPGGTWHGPHRPYEGLQRNSGHSPTPPGARGPHRPYEGLQRRGNGSRSGSSTTSSSPLRGIATAANRLMPRYQDARPHRPYEGLQPGALWVTERLDARGPHRPYEGLQPGYWTPFSQLPLLSSSPLRGIATPAGRSPADAPHPSSSPLRGIATGMHRRHRRGGRRCPHRPYEGLQPDHRAVTPGRQSCPHRPYEGLQPAPVTGVGVVVVFASSSPLRGIATGPLWVRTGDTCTRSSSPLRGIATT